MKTLNDYFAHFQALAKQGKSLEIIDLYYSEQIVQYENNVAAYKSKAALLGHETTSLAKVNSLEISVQNVVIDEARQMIWGEMTNRFELKKGGKKILNEAFFQQWEDGKIVVQKFYYKGVEDD
ncbi:MAG: nuclear transport factor 2 family protein [Bacteroidota bacterium]